MGKVASYLKDVSSHYVREVYVEDEDVTGDAIGG